MLLHTPEESQISQNCQNASKERICSRSTHLSLSAPIKEGHPTKLKTIKFVVLYLTDPEIQNTTHLARSGVLSSLALCSSPLVQANIEAIGLVDVALPCWC